MSMFVRLIAYPFNVFWKITTGNRKESKDRFYIPIRKRKEYVTTTQGDSFKTPLRSTTGYQDSFDTPLRTSNRSQESFNTPCRNSPKLQSHKSTSDSEVPDVQLKDNNKPLCGPRNLPSFPLIRNPSQIGFLGSRISNFTPPKSKVDTGKNHCESLSLASFDVKTPDVHDRRCNSALDNRCLSESYTSIRVQSEISLLGSNKGSPVMRNTIGRNHRRNVNLNNLIVDKLLNYHFMEPGNISRKKRDFSKDFNHILPQKETEPSLVFHRLVEKQLDMQSNESSETSVPMRRLQLRNNHYSTPGCSRQSKPVASKIPIRILKSANQKSVRFMDFSDIQSKPAPSKIPVRKLKSFSPKSAAYMNFPERITHRGIYTQSATRNFSRGMPGTEKRGDTADIRFNDIENLNAFRVDTSKKFERMFSVLSKKKHTLGNIIDATTHAQWMRAAGVTDIDGTMFKRYVGAKVVLNFDEYKVFLHKICTVYDIDYFDVLHKMATFEEEEFHSEDQPAPWDNFY